MDSQSASKLPIRLVMALLVSVLSSSAFAQPSPAWGTQDSSVLTIAASDFASMDDTQTTYIGLQVSAANNVRLCLEPGDSYPTACRLRAGISLPSGALIEHMEFAACDFDPDSGVEAALQVWEGLEQGLPATVASITTQGAAGCLFWTSGYIGITVENLSNDYSVTVTLPDVFISFRSVRIFYSLQVSPAPAFASFNDVPTSHPFFQYVEALYASGITLGCGGGNFCPNSSLTRGQMAVFLAKALGLHFPN
jgi:S-layer homology domain